MNSAQTQAIRIEIARLRAQKVSLQAEIDTSNEIKSSAQEQIGLINAQITELKQDVE